MGIILKFLSSAILGPGISSLWTLLEYSVGDRSGPSAAMSLALAGVVDFDLDCSDFEVDPDSSEEACEFAAAVAGELISAGAEEMSRYSLSRTRSGLYVARVAIVEVDGRGL